MQAFQKICTAWSLSAPSKSLMGEDLEAAQKVFDKEADRTELVEMLDKLVAVPYLLEETKDKPMVIISSRDKEEIAQVQKSLQESFQCSLEESMKSLSLAQRSRLTEKGKELMQAKAPAIAKLSHVDFNKDDDMSLGTTSSPVRSSSSATHSLGSSVGGEEPKFDNDIFFLDAVLDASSAYMSCFENKNAATMKARLQADVPEFQAGGFFCDVVSTGYRLKLMKPQAESHSAFSLRMNELKKDLDSLFQVRRPTGTQRVVHQSRVEAKKKAEKRILDSSEMLAVMKNASSKMARRGADCIIREQERGQLQAGWTSLNELKDD